MRTFLYNTLAVVAGYLAMAIIIFIVFTLAYLIMGPDRAFKPAVYDVSTLWIAISFLVGLSAAILGGKVCRLIARNLTAPKYLIMVVGAWGVLLALMAVSTTAPELGIRAAGEPTAMQAMNVAIQPDWISWSNPFIGMLGAALGSGLLLSRRIEDCGKTTSA